jgi:hypothetical protein
VVGLDWLVDESIAARCQLDFVAGAQGSTEAIRWNYWVASSSFQSLEKLLSNLTVKLSPTS